MNKKIVCLLLNILIFWGHSIYEQNLILTMIIPGRFLLE